MTHGLTLCRLRYDLSTPRNLASSDIFLVGGVVRDGIVGRRHRSDIDLAVADGEEELARRLARRGWGKAFRIAGTRHGISVWRVAGSEGTVDIARFGGDGSLAGDLGRRDFTINAMARNLRTGRLFDPFGGRRDLQRRLIRSIADVNFNEDPLRLLRAYRFAAELAARIVPSTRASIRARASIVSGIAAERIRDEMVRLLGASGPDAALAIAAASKDGVLAAAFGLPDARPLAAGPIRETEGKASVPDRLALLFRRASLDAAGAARCLTNGRFGSSLARRVGGRLLFLEAALDLPFDGRRLYRTFETAFPPSAAFVSASATTAAERRRARRVRTWLSHANTGTLPAAGGDIAAWLAIAPGPILGGAIAEARYRYFIGQWRDRRAIRTGLKRWFSLQPRIDHLPGVG